ncbi:MAG: response regulator receiver protein [Micrococcaceae bacterium]|nr:response regulator receiver protein [Micrococcaceae bacterium]
MTEAKARPHDSASLQDLVLESEDMQQFLDALVRIAAAQLSGSSAGEVLAGVTLLRPRTSITVASSSPQAQKMDEIQYRFDDGPCLRAAREGNVIWVDDFLSEPRFPKYAEAIAEHGIRSALGIPVLLGGNAAAGLDFYSPEAGAFDEMAVTAAEKFAAEASQAMRTAVRIAYLQETAHNLRSALDSRTMIDLAAGIIMGQNRCSQEQAVHILKAASSARNLKLRDVAVTVVESTSSTPAQTHFEE